MKRMITTIFFAPVTFLKRAPRIIIHLARNAEKGGGVLMAVTLSNLNHSFIFPVPDPVPVPVPIPDFRVFHTPRYLREYQNYYRYHVFHKDAKHSRISRFS